MALKGTLLPIFTWWNGQTMSLALYTARRGQFVGTDELGNKYYRAQGVLGAAYIGDASRAHSTTGRKEP